MSGQQCEGPCEDMIIDNACVKECDHKKFKIKGETYYVCLDACPDAFPYLEGSDTCTNVCPENTYSIADGIKKCVKCVSPNVKVRGDDGQL